MSMAIYAIGDPHLSFTTGKPMDIFGASWENHVKRMQENWIKTVKDTDTVIIPGDISWAMSLVEVIPDLKFLDDLPGEKIISKGNHDYWWGTMGKIDKLIQDNGFSSLHFLKNNAIQVDQAVVCAARGWIHPTDQNYTAKDEIIYLREIARLKRSLEEGIKLLSDQSPHLIAALHYPPLYASSGDTEFSEILETYNVELCIYGHLHGKGIQNAFEGVRKGVMYKLVSADYLSFTPFPCTFPPSAL